MQAKFRRTTSKLYFYFTFVLFFTIDLITFGTFKKSLIRIAYKGLFFILGAKTSYPNRNSYPEKSVIISNHRSTLDAVFFGMEFCPKKDTILADSTGFMSNSVVKFIFSWWGATVCSRDEITSGNFNDFNSILIFPEGRRTQNGELRTFKRGYIKHALNMKRNIVLVKHYCDSSNFSGDLNLDFDRNLDFYIIKIINYEEISGISSVEDRKILNNLIMETYRNHRPL